MNTKHTPAPWVYNGRVITANDGYPICSSVRNNSEMKANAKLIAAAPELLEALQRALNDFRCQNWTEETYNIIESAIKKATE